MALPESIPWIFCWAFYNLHMMDVFVLEAVAVQAGPVVYA